MAVEDGESELAAGPVTVRGRVLKTAMAGRQVAP